MHDGLKDFGLNGLLSLNGSVRIGLGLCLHVDWQLEGVELRLLQVLGEVWQLARL